MSKGGERSPLVFRPDAGARIVEVDVVSPRDLEECLRLIDAFAGVAAEHPGCAFLVNVREVRFVPSPAETLAIANRIHAHRDALAGRAIACVLPRNADRGTGRVVAVLAQGRGTMMDVFTNAATARTWLRERQRLAAVRAGA